MLRLLKRLLSFWLSHRYYWKDIVIRQQHIILTGYHVKKGDRLIIHTTFINPKERYAGHKIQPEPLDVLLDGRVNLSYCTFPRRDQFNRNPVLKDRVKYIEKFWNETDTEVRNLDKELNL